jgi:hypothetical protein
MSEELSSLKFEIECFLKEGYKTRLPRGYLVYDPAISELDSIVRKLKEAHESSSSDTLVLCEPVVALGTIFLGGKAVAHRVEIALGKGSVIASPPPLIDNYIVLEMDAWGDALKVMPNSLTESLQSELEKCQVGEKR